ncbi:hypothetical protein ECZU31_48660 [Escherichia coli]|nr:hypothetical protein ECZU31_48660 [Escherichia coli]
MLQFSFVSNDVVMTYDGDSGEQIIWVWESLNKFQTVCISRIFNFQPVTEKPTVNRSGF